MAAGFATPAWIGYRLAATGCEQTMAETTVADWAISRRKLAKAVASTLYGVIAIMSADLAYEPGRASRHAVATGAFLVGFAMALTYLFVHLAEDETRLGSHLEPYGFWNVLSSALWVMLFPSVIAVLVLLGQFVGLPSGALAELLPYLSVVTVTVLGFGSSYALRGQIAPALARGVSWTLLSLVLFVAKELAL
jgi:hypothetical protein